MQKNYKMVLKKTLKAELWKQPLHFANQSNKLFWPASVLVFWFSIGIFLSFPFSLAQHIIKTQCFGHNVTWTCAWKNMLHSPRKHPQNQNLGHCAASLQRDRHFTEHRLILRVHNKYMLKNWLLLTPMPSVCCSLTQGLYLCICCTWSHSLSPPAAGQILNVPIVAFFPVTGSSPTECSECCQALHQSHLKPSFAAQK